MPVPPRPSAGRSCRCLSLWVGCYVSLLPDRSSAAELRVTLSEWAGVCWDLSLAAAYCAAQLTYCLAAFLAYDAAGEHSQSRYPVLCWSLCADVMQL